MEISDAAFYGDVAVVVWMGMQIGAAGLSCVKCCGLREP